MLLCIVVVADDIIPEASLSIPTPSRSHRTFLFLYLFIFAIDLTPLSFVHKAYLTFCFAVECILKYERMEIPFFFFFIMKHITMTN